jgi:hypothetical protein
VPAAELRGKIGLDTSDLDRGQNAVRAFEHNITSAFRRTGDLRAGRALEGFIANITGGNVAGAIESIATRLTGLGLLGGVAFGLITGAIVKGIAAMKEFREASLAANQRLSVGPTGEHGTERIAADFKTLGDIAKNNRSIFSGMFEGPVGAFEKLELTRRTYKDIVQTAQAQIERGNKLVEIEKLKASGATDEAAKAKISLDTETKIGQAKKDSADLTGFIKEHQKDLDPLKKKELENLAEQIKLQEKATAKSEKRAEIAPIDREAQLRKEGIQTQEKENEVKRLGLSADQEKIGLAQIHVMSLQTQLRIMGDMSNQAKELKQAELERAKVEVEVEQRKSRIDILKPILEKSQLSFQELLTGPRGGTVTGGSGVQTLRDAQLAARRAQQELNLAEQARLKGRTMESFQHLSRAEEIKSRVGMLRESEKLPEYAFRSAIDSAQVFQEMVSHLQKISEGLPLNLNNM